MIIKIITTDSTKLEDGKGKIEIFNWKDEKIAEIEVKTSNTPIKDEKFAVAFELVSKDDDFVSSFINKH